MKKTLLVLAAGMGSRYGGLKQLETFGPNEELLMEYGIYDAIKAGFNKVVFVIKQDFAGAFIPLMDELISGLVEVHYVFQEMEDLPSGYIKSYERKKPWGTAHAIWVTRNIIKEPFLIMNADDFYGANAFKVASSFFDRDHENFAVVSYNLGETLSEYGGVNRGVCFTEKDSNKLKEITEVKGIEKQVGNELTFISPKELNAKLNPSDLVSMNMFCLRPSFFPLIEKLLKDFLEDSSNISNEELLIPHVIENSIVKTNIQTIVLNSKSDWFGVTYKEDRATAMYKIEEKTKKGLYPKKMFRVNNDTAS